MWEKGEENNNVEIKKSKHLKTVFQIFFIAQIQVGQQYSSLTTQHNSMAVTRKAWIHSDVLYMDHISVQHTVTNHIEVFHTCWLVGNVGLKGSDPLKEQRNLPLVKSN